MQDGFVYELPTLGPVINGIGGGCLPTPTASDSKGAITSEVILRKRILHPRGVRLEEHLAKRLLIPTPSAGSNHSAGRLDEWGGKNPFRGTDIGKLHLSPGFVEELMGFPIEFTALKDWVTPKSRFKQQQHGSCSEDHENQEV
jgi:hypothetical protein